MQFLVSIFFLFCDRSHILETLDKSKIKIKTIYDNSEAKIVITVENTVTDSCSFDSLLCSKYVLQKHVKGPAEDIKTAGSLSVREDKL